MLSVILITVLALFSKSVGPSQILISCQINFGMHLFQVMFVQFNKPLNLHFNKIECLMQPNFHYARCVSHFKLFWDLSSWTDK